ncbi:MAG: RagB/SusD family nutrient uptake outer membrane protein [Candidatus Cyclobacteriaceae bacterium M2_1C_046]
MKNNIKYLLILIMVFSLSACDEEFLEIAPQDRVVADNFYRSESEIRAATASLYGYPWFQFNDRLLWTGGNLMSGDMHHTWSHEGQFFFFTFNAGNSYINEGWSGLYRVVSYSNSIINDMPRVAEGNVPQEIIDRGVAEARFMRAAAYYHLVEFFGEVPIVENSTELVSSNNMMLPKNTRMSVYEFIKRDLEFAAEHLLPNDEPGRVTQWAAKGLLAKVYLTRAQNLSNPTSADDFQKAKEIAADVIDNSGLALLNNYDDLFSIDNNNNQESLFALQWLGGGSYGTGNSHQAIYARNPIITGNSQAWGQGKSASLSLLNDMAEEDERSYSIIMELGNHYPTINKAEGGYTYNIVTVDEDGAQIESAAPLLNNIKKYVVGSALDHPGKVGNNQNVGMNTYILRLADVYLIYAEAAIGAGGSTTDPKAVEVFNAIRERAGLPSITTITFEDVLKERRVEFAFEGNRWFDIKRMYYRDPIEAMAYLDGQQRGMVYRRITGPDAPDANSVEGYELFQESIVNPVTEDKMFLPIPAGEVQNNPNLAPEVEAVEYDFN